MKKESILIIVIIILAVISRLAFLDLRVLHHDEGVNYFFAKNIISGYGYQYNPLNYHGPLYFFILALSFLIFGISEFSLRLPAALFGIALVLLPLIWKRNEFNRYIASLLLLISPSLLYYSRYSIHEIAFVLFSLVLVYAFTKILETKNIKKLPLFAVSLAFLFALKETAIITLFIVFMSGLINLKRIKKINFREEYHLIFASVFLFAFIYVLLFTSFFTNPYGIADSVRGFLPWTDRGIEGAGHDKPFYYYVLILLKYEWPIFILSLFGLYFAYKSKNIFSLNISLLFLLNFMIYSIIPYKTPWLTINITAPMCLLAAVGLKNIEINKFNKNHKTLFYLFILIGMIYLIYFSFTLNFINTWQKDNKFAYVHTDRDIINLADEVNQIYKKDSVILIISDVYWPLPFYLHGKNVSYLEEYNIAKKDFDKYDIMIIKDKFFDASKFPEYNYESYRLREGVELILVWER